VTAARLDRRDVVRRLLGNRGDLVVVAGLGASAYDVAAAGDSPLDFPLWGAMGGAAMVGLGLAIAQPNRTVLVLTGDGEMLMGLGSLATIAAERPANLRIVVLDNERFGETGNQLTHTGMGTDLTVVATGCGIADVRTVTTPAEVDRLRDDVHRASGGEPLFAVIKISSDPVPRALPPRDGPYLAHRIRAALLGDAVAHSDEPDGR
jgi:thiamine pyrophosphate-dependent acetolactate synthase large subunit-like protein